MVSHHCCRGLHEVPIKREKEKKEENSPYGAVSALVAAITINGVLKAAIPLVRRFCGKNRYTANKRAAHSECAVDEHKGDVSNITHRYCDVGVYCRIK